jgi:hypothetical protein
MFELLTAVALLIATVQTQHKLTSNSVTPTTTRVVTRPQHCIVIFRYRTLCKACCSICAQACSTAHTAVHHLSLICVLPVACYQPLMSQCETLYETCAQRCCMLWSILTLQQPLLALMNRCRPTPRTHISTSRSYVYSPTRSLLM